MVDGKQQYTGYCEQDRVTTVKEKSRKNENFSMSGKSQGVFFEKSGKVFDIVKVSEKSGNYVFGFQFISFLQDFEMHFHLETMKSMLQSM